MASGRRMAGSIQATAGQFVADSPLEGGGFELPVPRQEKWSMPSSSDQTRVGRTLILGGGAESSWRAETSNSRSRRKTSVLRPMISARTARIDDNLGKGTDGSNPVPSSGESAANLTSLTKSGPPLSDYFRGFEL